MEKSSHKYKSVIFKDGEKAKKLYLVATGEILCLKASKDRLIPVFLARQGDIIGENAMTVDSEYTYSAIAMDNSELVEIPTFYFKTVFNKTPDWVENLLTTMIGRFQNTSSLIAENRIVNEKIISDSVFTPEIEIEFKKLLS